MTIFYPGPEVRITHEVFLILGPPPKRLKINELRDIHIVQRVGAFALIAPRTYELRAVYRGLAVCLYASSDLRRFGQVRRALVRAVEAAGTDF